MTRVLLLGINDRLWHVFAALGTLKGGRVDWFIEKCTELGASSVTPILTERCHTVSENRVDRLQREKSEKEKEKSPFTSPLHIASGQRRGPPVRRRLSPPPTERQNRPKVKESELLFVAVAEAPPLLSVLRESTSHEIGLLIFGPEGDFTSEELKMMKEAGSKEVGLGPTRLRVETATIALLQLLCFGQMRKLKDKVGLVFCISILRGIH
ncbi:hypothetical protein LUZ60_006514 [Juncus effusus]|nr:hypothetical protein LUZ60_006514 [Juncus effusus]